MSVRFDVLGGSTKFVDMSNGTARSVLALLGQDNRGYLEGKLPASQVRKLLAAITPEAVNGAEVHQRGPYDAPAAPSPREWLESRIAGLLALVVEAERTGQAEIIWR